MSTLSKSPMRCFLPIKLVELQYNNCRKHMFPCQEKKQHFLTWNNYIKPKIRFDFQEILSKQNDALLIST